jgi:hypothetical protein
MKNHNAQGREVSSDVVSLVVEGEELASLRAAAETSFEVAAGVIMVSDGDAPV